VPFIRPATGEPALSGARNEAQIGGSSQMKLGYFMMPLHHIDRDYHTTLQEDAEAIIHADQLGYSEAWVGEHYSSAVEQITSPLQFLSSLIPQTKQIKLCTGVICMPQYHPGVTAGQCAMFDHMSEGRFIMGVGPGGLPSDFELFGVQDADRNAMMMEALDHILNLWQGEPPYDLKGEYWSINFPEWTHHDIKTGYVAKPYTKPHPPIAISGMSPFSGSVTYAGSRGYMPVSANFVGEWVLQSHWPAYLKGANEAGIEADPQIWHVARSIYVADSDAEAEAFVKQDGGAYDFYYKYLFTIFDRADIKAGFVVEQGDDPAELSHVDLRDKLVIYGSPQTVADRIVALREKIGDFGTLLYAAHDWIDKAPMKNSMRLMAEEVMPRVNDAIGSRAAAE